MDRFASFIEDIGYPESTGKTRDQFTGNTARYITVLGERLRRASCKNLPIEKLFCCVFFLGS